MKHFLWLFILIPLVCYGADSKITDLPDVGASSDDVMYVVDNPGLSTASDNKITLGNLLLFFATQDMTLTGTIDASGATVIWPATITTTTFVGALTGNADTATTALSLTLADDSTITPPVALPSTTKSGVIQVDDTGASAFIEPTSLCFFMGALNGLSFECSTPASARAALETIPYYGELTTEHFVIWFYDDVTDPENPEWKVKSGDLPAEDNTTNGKIVKKVVTTGVHTLEDAEAGTDYVAPGGALGTPSGGTLTNCTGLPISTGVAGLGTGVGTALGSNVGSAGAFSRIIASGSTELNFGSTATGKCATVIQASATGVATTDVIIFNPNASIKAITGYVPASTGGFSITAFPTSNYVNFEACNWTAGTVDPGAITVNWMVIR